MEQWKLDARVQERFLRRGELTDKEVQSFLRSLEDLEEKAEESSLEGLLPKSYLVKLAGKAEPTEETDDKKE